MMPSSIVRQHTVSQSSSGTVYVQCQLAKARGQVAQHVAAHAHGIGARSPVPDSEAVFTGLGTMWFLDTCICKLHY